MRFAPAVFLSALLLFLLQSLAGKHLLPWFGGAPGTWAACLMFFQVMLLAGYAWAWALDRWCPPRWQRPVHVGLLLLACGWLWVWAGLCGAPLLPPDTWKPRGAEAPAGLILKALLAGTGLPFLLLAAHSPLLQRWAGGAGLTTRRVYRLYALSNAGSLLGLLVFPAFLEPRWALPDLTRAWAWGFTVLTVIVALASFVRPAPLAEKAAPAADPEPTAGKRPLLLWTALSAAASAVLISTTNQICQEIALVPFLWVLPLALYLIAFMITFHDARWYRRGLAAPAMLASLVALGFAVPGISLPGPWVILALSVFLLLFCLVGLGELYRLKPDTSGLTAFYLAIAAGGALGGIAVGIGAPLLLSSVTEFQWSMCLGWLAAGVAIWRDRGSFFHRGSRLFHAVTVFFFAAGFLRLVTAVMPDTAPAWQRGWLPALTAGVAITAVLDLLTRRLPGWQLWRFWPRMFWGTVIFCAWAFTLDGTRDASLGVLASGRNFFGAVRVQKAERNHVKFTRLVHGQVDHGFQYDEGPLRDTPAGYCHPGSGIGLAIAGHARRHPATGNAQPLRIGVAGLGIGAMAGHLHAGDTLRFYEINPLVIDWAAGPDAFFSCIRDSAGTVETRTGDARLVLERELLEGGSDGYDILVLDAFSSDSVPVHLLTVEAFTLYLQHLRDEDSLLAVNISNRFLDFRPLLRTVAAHFGLEAALFFDPGAPPVPTPNLWMILARKPQPFFALARPWPAPEPPGPLLWTDNHSDIFRLLRWHAHTGRLTEKTGGE